MEVQVTSLVEVPVVVQESTPPEIVYVEKIVEVPVERIVEVPVERIVEVEMVCERIVEVPVQDE